jgi:hypothetical protein
MAECYQKLGDAEVAKSLRTGEFASNSDQREWWTLAAHAVGRIDSDTDQA